jgi:hypothetical protein
VKKNVMVAQKGKPISTGDHPGDHDDKGMAEAEEAEADEEGSMMYVWRAWYDVCTMCECRWPA